MKSNYSTEVANGFTLLELILVMLILAVTAGVVIPRIGAGWKRMEDREFLQDFTQNLKRGRLLAISSGKMMTLRISGIDRTYGFTNPPAAPIPPNVDITADRLEQDPDTMDFIVLFYPDGSISTGTDMEVSFDHQRTFGISVHPILGTISITRVD